MTIDLLEVQEHTDAYRALLDVANQLNQAKYIMQQAQHSDETILIGAFLGDTCIGFLRCDVQVIGRDAGRPPVYAATGVPLREGYVEAFGVLPTHRRQGIGRQMQERAIALCMQRDCYQMRSRSPVTSTENYALKLKMGYAVHPSHENDSYYFIKTLPRLAFTVEER